MVNLLSIVEDWGGARYTDREEFLQMSGGSATSVLGKCVKRHFTDGTILSFLCPDSSTACSITYQCLLLS